MKGKILTLTCLTIILFASLLVSAGNLGNSSTPGATMYTLEDIYNLIHNNDTTTEASHNLGPSLSPDTLSSYSVSQLYADLANLIKRENIQTGTTYLGVAGNCGNPDPAYATTTVISASLTPTVSLGGPLGYSLDDIYHLITDNATTTAGTHGATPASTPAASMHTLTQIYTALASLISPANVVTGTTYLGQAGSASCGGPGDPPAATCSTARPRGTGDPNFMFENEDGDVVAFFSDNSTADIGQKTLIFSSGEVEVWYSTTAFSLIDGTIISNIWINDPILGEDIFTISGGNWLHNGEPMTEDFSRLALISEDSGRYIVDIARKSFSYSGTDYKYYELVVNVDPETRNSITEIGGLLSIMFRGLQNSEVLTDTDCIGEGVDGWSCLGASLGLDRGMFEDPITPGSSDPVSTNPTFWNNAFCNSNRSWVTSDPTWFDWDPLTNPDWTLPAITCTDFTYDEWSACTNGQTQRTVLTQSPEGCAGEPPIEELSQGCIPTCTDFSYSDWSTCSGGNQTRTVVTTTPEVCEGGEPVLSQSCSGEGWYCITTTFYALFSGCTGTHAAPIYSTEYITDPVAAFTCIDALPAGNAWIVEDLGGPFITQGEAATGCGI